MAGGVTWVVKVGYSSGTFRVIGLWISGTGRSRSALPNCSSVSLIWSIGSRPSRMICIPPIMSTSSGPWPWFPVD